MGFFRKLRSGPFCACLHFPDHDRRKKQIVAAHRPQLSHNRAMRLVFAQFGDDVRIKQIHPGLLEIDRTRTESKRPSWGNGEIAGPVRIEQNFFEMPAYISVVNWKI